jgi:hypothetical protein
MIENISIKIRIRCDSHEEALIIHDSLKPDNLSTPPIEITSNVFDNVLEVKIKNIVGTETALAAIVDLLNSYELSTHILQEVKEFD